ncbi:hypothetical protein BEWA_043510 [Theileria equi strain WA]|uniref:Uncharacterized protein n=1 Tax=Theileria equi strain WA TaxID=1537102 RepID=L1LGE0_THEEQ|nr:hypothetical protein BEWA_043510 [Theileria equi strain WA]EKX74310.1 hypothetical protein BEWA_043510 [Theileria equi strain WA]|eukprot:XP_004833762.1 hypothetical protein BEWA_043510 [Theileria equi strain WA]
MNTQSARSEQVVVVDATTPENRDRGCDLKNTREKQYLSYYIYSDHRDFALKTPFHLTGPNFECLLPKFYARNTHEQEDEQFFLHESSGEMASPMIVNHELKIFNLDVDIGRTFQWSNCVYYNDSFSIDKNAVSKGKKKQHKYKFKLPHFLRKLI